MLRTLFCACLVLLLCGGVVLTAEKTGVLTEVKDHENGTTTVTFQQVQKKEKVGDPVNLPVSRDVKVVHGLLGKWAGPKPPDPPIQEGLCNRMFAKDNLSEKGVRVRIVTEGEGDQETVTEIRVYGGKGSK
jgi:hypothetical protein